MFPFTDVPLYGRLSFYGASFFSTSNVDCRPSSKPGIHASWVPPACLLYLTHSEIIKNLAGRLRWIRWWEVQALVWLQCLFGQQLFVMELRVDLYLL